MAAHTTNYINTLIEIAEDCPTNVAMVPASKQGKTTVANHQFDHISNNPYHHTSDDIIFEWYAQKNEITKDNINEARETFFSKGQPCLRTSPLAKKHGWGIHSDADGKIAILAVESEQYKELLTDDKVKKVKAMRSKRD